ncbi:hypothetical protein Xoosp13_27 [Xanthomonas phage Xoo-sp13]|nr:hypothetical protein Xoosp13_27 [Xanthomonas phage Xoo-sp13]
MSKMIVSGADYFTMHCDDGSVRIGMVSGDMVTIPSTHKQYAEIVALKTEQEVEDYFDTIYLTYFSHTTRIIG